jgi:6,7-dimethyl-8-ribityllumazine synthase
MKLRKGSYNASGWQIAIVVATFNRGITGRLLAASRAELRRQGVAEEAIEAVRVPGAFELPLVARALARLSALRR